jgi:curved DNA-binding protein CbpA
MRGIDELDHYDLLEIPRSATTSEIDRAYRLSQQIYGEGSLAIYSIFENSDAEDIRDRLDEAYRVLSDPEFRAAYDVSQSERGQASIETFQQETRQDESNPDVSASEVASPSVAEAVEEYETFEDDGGGDFDGLRLRKTRLFRGYEIDDIADVTKVSGTHLRNIEAENFVDLPADVYVRGFVTAYATTIGLDPKVVVPSYMTRVQESRNGNQRGRFLGRG